MNEFVFEKKKTTHWFSFFFKLPALISTYYIL